MKKWKRTGSIIHARSGECAPVVCIASSVEHARLIEVAPQAVQMVRLLAEMLDDVLNIKYSDSEMAIAIKKAERLIKRSTK